ncbi:MAG: AAA family ATPase, partial [Candidatus Liptonbacteria bacterium]|nr:AAA family ATPase [Candidatus Liptonbacteria bacterium]
GKTHIINRFISWLRERGVEPAITASTGIAATHVGGLTIHSWSGIGIKEKLSGHDLRKIAENKRVAKRVRDAHTLIIEEISMLSAGTLEMVELVCRSVRGGTQPFGGLQVVLVGDFFQLPPIAKRPVTGAIQEELFSPAGGSSAFAFDSPVWRELNPAVCYLSEQHRQNDGEFLGILSAIRKNSTGKTHRALLQTRIVRNFSGEATKLFSHNANVDILNDKELLKLPGKIHSYKMENSGSKDLVANLKRGCLSPEILSLKIGARVMFTKNDQARCFINGTLGIVTGFSGENNFPLIKTTAGKTIVAETEEWHIEDGGRVLAKIKQIPLRLAWAITIHKSQGMSLDAAYMDLSKTFEYGQGYVALSRVRSFSGLMLYGFNERALQVHPEVRAKDLEFQDMSIVEESKIESISKDELEQMQKDFIRKCGGKRDLSGNHISSGAINNIEENFENELNPAESGGGSSYLEKIREKYPNAYRAWSAEEDQDLIRRYMTGEGVAKLTEVFGRQRGSIRARIIKLGLAGE